MSETKEQRIERMLSGLERYEPNGTFVKLSDVRAALTAFSEEEANKWQPIETAPKEIVKQVNDVRRFGRRMLVLTRKGTVRIARWWEPASANPVFLTDDSYEVEPTHWQPLPEAPKQD